MKSPIVAGILVVIILGCVVFLFSWNAMQPEPGEPIPHPMPAVCEKCEKNYAAMVGKQPAKCGHCGEIALWRAVKCQKPDCGTFFPYKAAAMSISEQPEVICPKCNGRAVTHTIAENELGPKP